MEKKPLAMRRSRHGEASYSMGLLLNLFNKYLVRTYYMPGIVLGTGDIAMNMAKILNSWGLQSSGEKQTINR